MYFFQASTRYLHYSGNIIFYKGKNISGDSINSRGHWVAYDAMSSLINGKHKSFQSFRLELTME